ncbi:MAG: N-acetylneuraminate synthase family protein [Magnetococcales bacterium]|nr:N-acetylneuraminate synthase family protein [Magnetococcales bacterium]
MLQRPLIPYESIFLIAETASSHEGDVDLAQKLADAVKESGAHAIKYQLQNPDNLLVPTHHKYASFKELQFNDREWRGIIGHAKALQLPVIAEVFDEESCNLALDLDIDVLKLPTSDLSNPHMIDKIVASSKTTILAVGGATTNEIAKAVSACTEQGHDKLILMHGFQSFPTKIEDTNLSLLSYLKQNYDFPIGFADHVDAESDMALVLPLVAVGFGATVIEKHFTLDRSLKGRDHYSALNPDEFKKLVAQTALIEKAYGKTPFGTSKAEVKYRELMKKKIVANTVIKAGETISLNSLSFRRSDENGLLPGNYPDILGRAIRDIEPFETITKKDVIPIKSS